MATTQRRMRSRRSSASNVNYNENDLPPLFVEVTEKKRPQRSRNSSDSSFDGDGSLSASSSSSQRREQLDGEEYGDENANNGGRNRGRNRKRVNYAESSVSDDEDDSDDHVPLRKLKKRRRKQKMDEKNKNAQQPTRSSERSKAAPRVQYAEWDSTNDEWDEESGGENDESGSSGSIREGIVDKDDQNQDEEPAFEEHLKIESVLARETKSAKEWKCMCDSMNTDFVKKGSRWLQDPIDESELESRQERFLIKWATLSYLHVSWETEDDIVDDVVDKKRWRHLLTKLGNAKHRHGKGNASFNSDYVKIDRILAERSHYVDGVKDKLTMYTVKWGSMGYDRITEEREEDIAGILGDHVDAFHRRSKVAPAASKSTSIRREAYAALESSPVFGKQERKLRDYQLDAVNWICFNWVNKRNSMLADEMGLGKTCQMVSCVHRLNSYYSMNAPTLIIAPLATLGHWKREFEVWCPDINCVVYHGNEEARSNIQEYEFFHKKGKGRHRSVKFDVLVTNFETALQDTSILAFKGKIRRPHNLWGLVIVDEAHRLKNFQSKLTACVQEDIPHNALVLLTGTPIQNNMRELWTLLNLLAPKQFGTQDEFEAKYGDMKTSEEMRAFHKTLQPFLLRRLKSDVEATLPPKHETIVEVELTAVQKKYYRAVYENNRSYLEKAASKHISLRNVAMELRKCCLHPYLIWGVEDAVLKEAGHEDAASDPSVVMDTLVQTSGKMVLMSKLLPKLKASNNRVLIFSQMVRMLDILEDYLDFSGYGFERIDGSVGGNERQEAIDRFNAKDSDSFVFLLSTRGCGQGINLTTADTVILFDSDWNPQNDMQAQARCHRIGQTKPVMVYRLVTRKTYEYEMFRIAAKKLGIDAAFLSSRPGKASPVPGADNPECDENVEHLLKRGAYALVENEENAEADRKQFCEADIDEILKRSRVFKIENDEKRKSVNDFAKATFVSSACNNIDVHDPEFWTKAIGASADVGMVGEKEMGRGRRTKKQVNYSEKGMMKNFIFFSDADSAYSDDSSQGDKEELDDDDDDYYARKKIDLSMLAEKPDKKSKSRKKKTSKSGKKKGKGKRRANNERCSPSWDVRNLLPSRTFYINTDLSIFMAAGTGKPAPLIPGDRRIAWVLKEAFANKQIGRLPPIPKGPNSLDAELLPDGGLKFRGKYFKTMWAFAVFLNNEGYISPGMHLQAAMGKHLCYRSTKLIPIREHINNWIQAWNRKRDAVSVVTRGTGCRGALWKWLHPRGPLMPGKNLISMERMNYADLLSNGNIFYDGLEFFTLNLFCQHIFRHSNAPQWPLKDLWHHVYYGHWLLYSLLDFDLMGDPPVYDSAGDSLALYTKPQGFLGAGDLVTIPSEGLSALVMEDRTLYFADADLREYRGSSLRMFYEFATGADLRADESGSWWKRLGVVTKGSGNDNKCRKLCHLVVEHTKRIVSRWNPEFFVPQRVGKPSVVLDEILTGLPPVSAPSTECGLAIPKRFRISMERVPKGQYCPVNVDGVRLFGKPRLVIVDGVRLFGKSHPSDRKIGLTVGNPEPGKKKQPKKQPKPAATRRYKKRKDPNPVASKANELLAQAEAMFKSNKYQVSPRPLYGGVKSTRMSVMYESVDDESSSSSSVSDSSDDVSIDYIYD